jgi:hypothetical protein
MVEDDRVGGGGEDLDRDEDAGEATIDLVPAGRKRADGPSRVRGRSPAARERGPTVGAGSDQQGDHGHRESDRDRPVSPVRAAIATTALHP